MDKQKMCGRYAGVRLLGVIVFLLILLFGGVPAIALAEQSLAEESQTEGIEVSEQGAEVDLEADGSFAQSEPSVAYAVHVQTYGDQDVRTDGAVAGTSGESKRLEGLWVHIEGAEGGVQYRTHVQTYGWQDWRSDGELAGTEGESKRLEAVQIRLTGKLVQTHEVWYRVHAQRLGWMAWAKDGELAGTAGLAWRLEALQIVLRAKGSGAPGNVAGVSSSASVAYLENPGVRYHTHVQTYGWQAWVTNGATSGTSSESKRMEALKACFAVSTTPGSLLYRTHVQTYGWQDWRSDGELAGTEGESKRLEAIQMRLSGDVSTYFDVWYRVHAQGIGWMAWACNGQTAGTVGLGLRLEAIQIQVLPKGSSGSLPSGDYQGAAVDATVEKPANMSIKLVPELGHGYKSPYYQRCIVMHDTTENRGFDYWIDEWIRRGGSGTHFMVNEDGEIRQYVDMNQICWHAGGPTYDYLDQKFNVVQYKDGAGSAMNQCSIGIEIDHIEDGRPYPEAQLDAIDRLIAYIDAYYGFECTILQHKDYRLINEDCSDEFQGYLHHLQQYRATR